MKNQLGYFNYYVSEDNNNWVRYYTSDLRYGNFKQERLREIPFDKLWEDAYDYGFLYKGRTVFKKIKYVKLNYEDTIYDNNEKIYLKGVFIKQKWDPTMKRLQEELPSKEYIQFLKDNKVFEPVEEK